jgi:predicted DNA-binding transcriptional regulator AlpA
MQSDQTYLPAADVRKRYGVSDMSLWRWLNNEALGFPRPIRINKRRFWRLNQLEGWEASRASSQRSMVPEIFARSFHMITGKGAPTEADASFLFAACQGSIALSLSPWRGGFHSPERMYRSARPIP